MTALFPRPLLSLQQHLNCATYNSHRPAVCLPGLNKPSVAVRFNPRLFSLKTDGEEVNSGMCDLPYRAVFAVVSLDAVVVYDTQHSYPLTIATGLHYAGLTDASW